LVAINLHGSAPQHFFDHTLKLYEIFSAQWLLSSL
jgi:hypothetical protein